MPKTEENKKKKLDILEIIMTPMYLLGFPDNSLDMLQEGEKLSKELDDRRLAIFYSRMGSFYSYKSEPLIGLKYSENAFEEAKKNQDVQLMASLAFQLCTPYAGVGQFSKIVDMAPGVIDLIEKTKRESDFFALPWNPYSELCGYCGYSKGWLGNFDQGKIFLEKGLRNASQINDATTLGYIEFFYGLFFFARGDWSSTIGHLRNSIKYFEKANWLLELALSWSFIGGACLFLGDPETARRHTQRGLKVQTDSGIEWYASTHHWILGMIHLKLNDLMSAQSFMEESIRLAQKDNMKHSEGASWIWLGMVLMRAEPPQASKAEECILKGIEMLHKIKIKPYYSQGHLFLGKLYLSMGKREKAIEHIRKAERMFREMKMDTWLDKTQKFLK